MIPICGVTPYLKGQTHCLAHFSDILFCVVSFVHVDQRAFTYGFQTHEHKVAVVPKCREDLFIEYVDPRVERKPDIATAQRIQQWKRLFLIASKSGSTKDIKGVSSTLSAVSRSRIM